MISLDFFQVWSLLRGAAAIFAVALACILLKTCYYLVRRGLAWLKSKRSTSTAPDVLQGDVTGVSELEEDWPAYPVRPPGEDGEVPPLFDDFVAACRLLVLGPDEANIDADLLETFEDAVEFARAICMGVAPFQPLVELLIDSLGGAEAAPVLRLKMRTHMRGEFATRSRIPFDIFVPEDGLELSLGALPPATADPFRCACYRRCFGPASGGDKPWAKLDVIYGEEGSRHGRRSFLAAPQAFEADLAGLLGAKIVAVPGNDFSAIDVRGAAAVVTEKSKGSMSDGAVARAAQVAGARCVIKVGGGGSMLYCVADPVAIPCIALTRDDGETLLELLETPLARRSSVRIAGYAEMDTRTDLISKRWQDGMVWLHCRGLYFRTIDWDNPFSRAVRSNTTAQTPLIYEDYYEAFCSRKDTDSKMSPDSSKLRRIVESAWSQLQRVGLATNPSMLGKMLALGGQRCEFEVNYVKFAPGESQANTAVSMLLTPIDVRGSDGGDRATSSELQAWFAHEAVYLALMGHFTKLIGFMAPSLWNFIKCFNGELFGWEADAVKMIKLFKPCTGPFGPAPTEQWQRNDPTWQIVDQSFLGVTTRSQGRVLWSEWPDAEVATTTTALELCASAAEAKAAESTPPVAAATTPSAAAAAAGPVPAASTTTPTLAAATVENPEVELSRRREEVRSWRRKTVFMRLIGLCMARICDPGRPESP
eukprot:TRINITY_DN67435_c0_g1_i1.p1 TRINITY_DN67435_c0_g1~~TRINITY_DN67435_c0_g1_i1.p1  ORF type:complete len:706 (-),score=129.88 TRINITY_DN67435_c0_g1_i1:87-2204(-)